MGDPAWGHCEACDRERANLYYAAFVAKRSQISAMVGVSVESRNTAERVAVVDPTPEDAEISREWEVIGITYTACHREEQNCKWFDQTQRPDIGEALRGQAPEATIHYLQVRSQQPVTRTVQIGTSDPSRQWWTDCLRTVVVGEPLPECAR